MGLQKKAMAVEGGGSASERSQGGLEKIEI